MKLFKKTTMSFALAAAMVGGMTMPQQASALPDPGAGAVHVNPNGLGQALIFPYYSVRGDLKSFFNITNTSLDTVAVKIRFYEGHNSRDALDFVVVLSPNDVWAAFVEAGPGLGDAPVVKTLDNSCVVGAPDIKGSGQPLSNVGYSDAIPVFEDQGTNSIDRTREGYFVAIAMGKVPTGSAFDETVAAVVGTNAWSGSVAYNALHQANGVPNSCDNVDLAFVATANTTLPVDFPFTDTDTPTLGDGDAAAIDEFEAFAPGENPLKGNFSIINADSGIGAGNAAVALADFMTIAPATPGTNLVTAQNFPYFLEPSLASADGIWTVSGLTAVETALSSDGIANEWANNPLSGAQTDWVITFPTKGFHVDHEDVDGVTTAVNIQASNNQWRVGHLALIGTIFEDNIDANGAEVTIGMTGYDREEQDAVAESGNTTPSPFPPGGVTDLVLQGEANIIAFGPSGTASALGAETFVLNFDVSDALANPAPNGWVNLGFRFDGSPQAFPAVGYAFKSRNQGDASLSFSQIVGHAWTTIMP